MPFPIRCVNPKCAKTLKVPNHVAGKPARCPICNQKMLAPVPEVFHCEIDKDQIEQVSMQVVNQAFEFIQAYLRQKRALWSIVQLDILWDPGVEPIWRDESLREWYGSLRKRIPAALYWLTEESAMLYLHMVAQFDPSQPGGATREELWRVITDTTPALQALLHRLFGEDEATVDRLVSRLCGRMQQILKRQKMENIFV